MGRAQRYPSSNPRAIVTAYPASLASTPEGFVQFARTIGRADAEIGQLPFVQLRHLPPRACVLLPAPQDGQAASSPCSDPPRLRGDAFERLGSVDCAVHGTLLVPPDRGGVWRVMVRHDAAFDQSQRLRIVWAQLCLFNNCTYSIGVDCRP